MGRLLLACVLGCAIFALVAWQLGFIGSEPPAAKIHAKETKVTPDLGGSLFPSAPKPASLGPLAERRIDPVVVLGTMAVKDRSEIAAAESGVLSFIGEEVPEGAAQAAGAVAFLAEPFESTKVNRGVRDVVQFYRRLHPTDMVYEDQVLALVDTAKALGDLETKEAKVVAAKNDFLGAKAIAAEAWNKLKQAEQAFYASTGRSISVEDYRNALLTKEKMEYDSVAKGSAVRVAELDLRMSQIINNRHRVLNKVPAKRSVVHKILKQRGEAVKELEAVMEIHGLDRLQAEAQIDDYYSKRIQKGMRVTL